MTKVSFGAPIIHLSGFQKEKNHQSRFVRRPHPHKGLILVPKTIDFFSKLPHISASITALALAYLHLIHTMGIAS